MAFVRRSVRLVGGDARPAEEGVRARNAPRSRSNLQGVGLIGPNGAVGPALTPDQKAEIESRLRAKWKHERDSGKLAEKVMPNEQRKRSAGWIGKKKKKKKRK